MSKEGTRYWRILELSFDGLGYFWPRYGEYSPQITCLLTCLTYFCFSMKTQHVCQGMFVDVEVPSYWLCLLFFQERTGLISLSDWSWRLLLHGDVWLPNSITRNDRSGKNYKLFLHCVIILCISGQEVMNAVKRWSHKSLFVEIFYSGYLSKSWLYLFQNVLKHFDDIVFTVGSGGSASGIAIGNYLTGSKLK